MVLGLWMRSGREAVTRLLLRVVQFLIAKLDADGGMSAQSRTRLVKTIKYCLATPFRSDSKFHAASHSKQVVSLRVLLQALYGPEI